MTSFKQAALSPPPTDRFTGCLLFVGSIFLPGVTQMLFGIAEGCDSAYILVGLLQVLISVLLLGWVWSILWGMRALANSSVKAAAAQAAAAPIVDEEAAVPPTDASDAAPAAAERTVEPATDAKPEPAPSSKTDPPAADAS